MKRTLFLIGVLLLALACSFGATVTPSPTAPPTPSSPTALQLTYVATHELPPGTHRPEILVTDSGDIYLVFVQEYRISIQE